jgi:hypothetical protein
VAGLLPGVLARRLGRSSRPRFASSEKLREAVLRTAVALTDPAVVAVYDDPVAQAATLGIPMDRGWLATLARRQRRNVGTFRWLVVPTASFADLADLPADRVIVGGNGTDTSAVRAGPWPERPTIGVVSAAAPGRGLELLVEAARLARRALPELQLRLWLVATNEEGWAYLDGLRETVRREPWVEIATAPYERLGETLAAASALAIPHPPGAYMDVALPVSFDCCRWRPSGHAVTSRGTHEPTSGSQPVATGADLARSRSLSDEDNRRRRASQVCGAVRLAGRRGPIADEVLRRGRGWPEASTGGSTGAHSVGRDQASPRREREGIAGPSGSPIARREGV